MAGHGEYSSLSHLTWRINIDLKNKNREKLLILLWWLKRVNTRCSSAPPSVKIYIYTCLHRHRQLSRSLFSSSSTTVTRGARSDTTPRSSGRKGCGPSCARKDAKPRKLCLSVASAESVKWQKREGDQGTRQKPETNYSHTKFKLLTIQDSQHHVPVLHTGPVEGHGGVGAQGEGNSQRGDQVEGLGQPLAGQLSGLDNGSETGHEGLRWGAGRDRGWDHRHGEVSGGISVRWVEGGVGTGHVQSNAFMLQDIDTWWS